MYSLCIAYRTNQSIGKRRIQSIRCEKEFESKKGEKLYIEFKNISVPQSVYVAHYLSKTRKQLSELGTKII